MLLSNVIWLSLIEWAFFYFPQNPKSYLNHAVIQMLINPPPPKYRGTGGSAEWGLNVGLNFEYDGADLHKNNLIKKLVGKVLLMSSIIGLSHYK